MVLVNISQPCVYMEQYILCIMLCTITNPSLLWMLLLPQMDLRLPALICSFTQRPIIAWINRPILCKTLCFIIIPLGTIYILVHHVHMLMQNMFTIHVCRGDLVVFQTKITFGVSLLIIRDVFMHENAKFYNVSQT